MGPASVFGSQRWKQNNTSIDILFLWFTINVLQLTSPFNEVFYDIVWSAVVCSVHLYNLVLVNAIQ